jgi:Xaa-Pro aminopeptidase
VPRQVDTNAFVPHQIPEDSPEPGSPATCRRAASSAFDPWLQTVTATSASRRAAARAGASFVAVEHNPIDAVWHDRPAPPLAPVLPHPVEFAGETSEQRRRRIADIVASKDADVALLTAPDSIAWLLNVRGGDVPRTPFALGFALLHTDGHVDLYMDRRKVPARTIAWLGNAVTLAPTDELGPALDMLGKVGKRVLLESSTAPFWAATRLQAAAVVIVRDADPVALPKACKNAVELAASAPPIAATARRLPASLGLARTRVEQRHVARDRGVDRLQALRQETASCATSRSTPSPALAPTARSCTTRHALDRAHPGAGARSTSSIPAGSTATAPPTSPAPCDRHADQR